VVRLVIAATLGVLVGLVAPAAAFPPRLPPAVFQDQDGRVLALESMLGRVAVIVYGGRAGVERHIDWGRRLAAELRARGRYRDDDPPAARPVWILAIAQMGGIPAGFRGVLRAAIRPHVEAGHSLWFDWDDVLSARFGKRDGDSTVIVVDPGGAVRLVTAGPPEGEPFRAVLELLRRLE
jgi:hypothetical protein